MIREITNLHFQQVTSVAISPDENTLLTMSRDNTLKLIDSRMFLPTMTLSAQGFRVPTNWSKSCFSSDGNYICAGSSDGSVYIWKNGTLVSTLSKHRFVTCFYILLILDSSAVVGVAWSPTGGSALYSVSDKEKSLIQWGE